MHPALDYRSEHARLRNGDADGERRYADILARFACHGLADRGEQMLANRTDAKYLLPTEAMEPFLHAISDDFNVLDIDGGRIFTYENTYFDTPCRALYLAHHNGKRNRRKCRLRRYRETDTSFLEYKLKINQTRTVKHRIPPQDQRAVPALEQWQQEYLQPGVELEAALHINYRRISLHNGSSGDRLTLDYDLRFSEPGGRHLYRVPDVFIAELKRPEKLYGSPFYRRAKSYGFLPQGISKYCIGTCLVGGADIKRNRFKPVLGQLGDVITRELQDHD